jgi:hypothetical protein
MMCLIPIVTLVAATNAQYCDIDCCDICADHVQISIVSKDITVIAYLSACNHLVPQKGKITNYGEVSYLGRCIISHQEVLRLVLQNVNH